MRYGLINQSVFDGTHKDGASRTFVVAAESEEEALEKLKAFNTHGWSYSFIRQVCGEVLIIRQTPPAPPVLPTIDNGRGVA